MSTTNPNARQRLEMLRGLRLRGQAPVGAVCVATDRDDVAMFEELKRPVIEVWRRDAGQLDWTPIAGLWVYVLIRNWPTDLRMELFNSIRAGEPGVLNWFATSRGPRGEPRMPVGNLWIVNGEPQEMWVTPELAVTEQAPEDWKVDFKRKSNPGGWYSYGCV